MQKQYIIYANKELVRTSKETLEKIPHFKNLLDKDKWRINSNTYEHDLEMDAKKFIKILDYVRFPTKPFPDDCYSEAVELGIIVDLNNEINVKINVGGKIMFVKKKILLKCNYFKTLFNGTWDKYDIFLDMNPITFEHIINYLTIKNYMMPRESASNSVIPAEIEAEIKFLGLEEYNLKKSNKRKREYVEYLKGICW